jgi:hypothetical protein
MKIAFLSIATNKYNLFITPFLKHFENYCKLSNVDIFLFTDVQEEVYKPKNINLYTHYITHLPWPIGNNMRYHYYLEKKEILKLYDYIYHIDIDMFLVSNISEEILEKRVCVNHPGFFMQPRSTFPYEKNIISNAYIPDDKGNFYFQNCFQGGESSEFIHMSETIKKYTEEDLKKYIFPHALDESYMNKYMVDNPPTKILSPGYAYPQLWNIPVEKKIIHVYKDHNLLESGNPG